MDLLRKEMQRKKEALAKAKQHAMGSDGDGDGDDGEDTTKKRKFIRQGDLRRMQEEEEDERQRQLALSRKRPKTQPAMIDSSTTASSSEGPDPTTTKKKKKKKKKKTTNDKEAKPLLDATTTTSAATTSTSITQQLRAFGLAIRYFGESHDQRVQRLQTASEQQTHVLQGLSEMEEFRLGKGHGIRNPFLGRDTDHDTKANTSTSTQPPRTTEPPKETKDEDHNHNHHNNSKKKELEEEEEDDPPKRIYKYFKGLLKEWERDLSERSDTVAKSVIGRNDSKTLKQCKDYVRPLFKLLKQRKIEAELQAHLLEIVQFAQQGEFVKAHDSYINVAIGRAAWPIGVTMVGIHARSGRAKIESSNVAHVMNSELQRKYLTSVKRLLTYAQKKRPDVDPSKKVA